MASLRVKDKSNKYKNLRTHHGAMVPISLVTLKSTPEAYTAYVFLFQPLLWSQLDLLILQQFVLLPNKPNLLQQKNNKFLNNLYFFNGNKLLLP